MYHLKINDFVRVINHKGLLTVGKVIKHIVDKETGMVRFNEKNAELLIESINDLKKIAKEFHPYHGGNDIGTYYDFTENLWDEIWNCWGK